MTLELTTAQAEALITLIDKAREVMLIDLKAIQELAAPMTICKFTRNQIEDELIKETSKLKI